jgi:hypothetical protein
VDSREASGTCSASWFFLNLIKENCDGNCEEGSGQEGRSEEGPGQEGRCEEGPGQEGRCEEGPGQEGRCEEGSGQEGGEEGTCCTGRPDGQVGANASSCLAIPDWHEALTEYAVAARSTVFCHRNFG